MKLINISDKAVTRKLFNNKFITLKPGESFNFPNSNLFERDLSLELVKSKLVKEKIVEKLKEKVVVEKPKKSKSVLSRIKEFSEDILDDGKRNYSNNPKKGRKKKKWLKNFSL